MDAEDLVALIQGDHLDERRTLEDRVLGAAGVDSRGARLDVAMRDIVREWTRLAGGPRSPIDDAGALSGIASMIRARINSALGGLGTAVYSSLSSALPAAQRLGRSQAAAEWLGQGGGPLGKLVQLGLGGLGKEAGAAGREAESLKATALRMISPVLMKRLGLSAALVPLQRSRSALDLVKAAVSRLVGKAMDKGAAQVTESIDAPFEVWAAERDACARCKAYSGKVVSTGSSFPGGLSLDPSQVKKDAVAVRPPLHPHCRCKLVPYDPDNHPPGATTLPEALTREAQRSAVRGWALPGESNASRLRAAQHVIDQEPDLPKSVIAYGRSAIRQGKFPRGRDVPNPPRP
jgi:hypothetical protein